MPLFAGTPLFNVLAGAGGAAQGYESAWEGAQKRDLEQQRINIEKQKALSEDLYRQQQLNQNFLSSDPLIGLANTLKLDPSAFGLKPGEKIDKAYVAAMMPLMLKEQERQQTAAENRARGQSLGTAVESTFPLEPVTRPQLGPVMEGAAPLPDVTAPEPNVPLRYRGAIEAAKQGLFEKGATVKDVLAMGAPTAAEQFQDFLNVFKDPAVKALFGGGDAGSPLAVRPRVSYGKEGPSVTFEQPPPEYRVIDEGIRAAWKADGNPGELTPDMPAYKMAFNYMVSGAQPLTEKGVLESKLNGLPNIFDSAAGKGAGPGIRSGPGPGGMPQTGPQVTGTPPGTPQPPATTPERTGGRTLITPRQAPPGPPPTLSPAEITQVGGAMGARQAAEAVKKAIEDPITMQYLGPGGSWRSTKDRWLPTFAGGKDVPPSVVDMEQNLATLNNYTIHLITGATVGNSSSGSWAFWQPSEAERIKAELPAQGYPPKEFKQRLDNTLARLKQTEDQIRSFALRGDQNAQLEAKRLGLGGAGGAAPAAPAIAPAAPPGATDLPPGATRIGNDIVSESGKYVYQNGRWILR
jgi:hypothetical protein